MDGKVARRISNTLLQRRTETIEGNATSDIKEDATSTTGGNGADELGDTGEVYFNVVSKFLL